MRELSKQEVVEVSGGTSAGEDGVVGIPEPWWNAPLAVPGTSYFAEPPGVLGES